MGLRLHHRVCTLHVLGLGGLVSELLASGCCTMSHSRGAVRKISPPVQERRRLLYSLELFGAMIADPEPWTIPRDSNIL